MVLRRSRVRLAQLSGRLVASAGFARRGGSAGMQHPPFIVDLALLQRLGRVLRPWGFGATPLR